MGCSEVESIDRTNDLILNTGRGPAESPDHCVSSAFHFAGEMNK